MSYDATVILYADILSILMLPRLIAYPHLLRRDVELGFVHVDFGRGSMNIPAGLYGWRCHSICLFLFAHSRSAPQCREPCKRTIDAFDSLYWTALFAP